MLALNVISNRHVAESKRPYGSLPEESPSQRVSYQGLVQSIVALHQESLGRAAASVNWWLSLRNWLIGAHLVEFEQHGEDRATYGERLLESIANDLRNRGVGGLGVTVLKACRQFYRVYPQVNQSIGSELRGVGRLPPIRQSVTGEFGREA